MSSKLPPPEKLRDAERSKTAILDAAEELFAQKGFEGTSFAEIGARAGVSRGTPGYFFGSKEELYRAVLEHSVSRAQQILEGLKPLTAQTSAEQTIELAVRGYMQFLVENPRFVRLVQWESLSQDRFLQQSPGNIRAFQESAELIGLLFASEVPRSSDSRQLMLSLMGLCWFPLVHGESLKHALGMDLSKPEVMEGHMQHIIRLLSGAFTRQKKGKQK